MLGEFPYLYSVYNLNFLMIITYTNKIYFHFTYVCTQIYSSLKDIIAFLETTIVHKGTVPTCFFLTTNLAKEACAGTVPVSVPVPVPVAVPVLY